MRSPSGATAGITGLTNCMEPGPGTVMVCGSWGMITTMTALMWMLVSTEIQQRFMQGIEGLIYKIYNYNLFSFYRVYPAAVAGTGKYFNFNSETDEAVLVYQPDPSIEQPTVLRVPVQWRYQEGGPTVVISPAGAD